MKKPARFNARRAREEENLNGLDSRPDALLDRHLATHCTAAPLTAPVEVAKLWKSRRHDIAIVVSLSTFEGQTIFDIRQHSIGADGIMRPTTKGLAMVVRRLPEIAAAIGKAIAKAKELHLLADDGGEQ
jgi:Transcriptional Coactivator p15 (PC4)